MTFSQTITLIDVLPRLQLISESLQYSLNFSWWILEFVLYAAVFHLVVVRWLGNQQSGSPHILMIGQLSGTQFSKRPNHAANGLTSRKEPLVYLNLRKGMFSLLLTHQRAYRQLFVCGLLSLFRVASGAAAAPAEVLASDKGNLA